MRPATLFVLTLSLSLAPHTTADDDLPPLVRDELEETLRTFAADLRKERNAEGREYRRGTYSKHFEPLEGERYRVGFTRDTAEADRMKSERLRLTLGRAERDRWEVVEEEILDTYEGLVRSVPGDEEFIRFDGFEISREGITVRAGRGTAVKDTVDGELREIVLASDDLEFDYTVPDDLGTQQAQVHGHLVQEYPDDLVFEPGLVTITCDPVTCGRFLQYAFKGVAPATRDDLHAPLARHYDDELQDLRRIRKEHPFSGFRRPMREDRRTFQIAVKRKGRDHRVRLVYDEQASWEVSVFVTGFGRLYGYPSEVTRVSGVPEHRIERRDDGNALDYDLVRLSGTVDLALGDSELVSAELEFMLRAKRDLREIPFSLGNLTGFGQRRSGERNPSITVDSLRTGDGEDLSWIRFGASSGLVVLPDTVPAGNEIVLRMSYQNRGSIIKLSPSYSYMDRSGWLPFVRYTDRIDEFDLTVRTPSRYKTLCVGTRMSEETSGEVRSSRFVAQSPVHFPTVIFGDYLEDSPKIRATRADGTPIPVTIHVDRDNMTSWGIRGSQLRPLAEQAVNALNLYREIYGTEYPYGKLDLVNQPGFLGGQAPASIVYLTSGAFRGEGTLAQVTTRSADVTRFAKTLVAHEVGHQWWGSLVSTTNFRNYWFVESLAEYSAALFVEAVASAQSPKKGFKAYMDHVGQWREEILDTDLLASVQDARTVWSGEGFRSYRAALYSKGPYAFHMLRMTFGDEKFFRFMRMLSQELAGRDIVTQDIQRIAEIAFEGSMDWFFDQWIRGIGLPEYRFDYTTRRAEDGTWIVQGTVRQKVFAGTKARELEGVYYRGVVPVTVLGKDRREYPKRVLVEGPVTEVAFKVPVKPLEVSINAKGEILLRDLLVNGGR